MKMPEFFAEISSVQEVAQNADHVDVKVYEGNVTLREFIAGFVNYNPGWIKFLYRVRAVFVRFLGMKQKGVPPTPHIRADAVPMERGSHLTFFRVNDAQEDKYWIASASDKHLSASLAIGAEAISGGRSRFYVVTLVKYHNWAGPVYFNAIRPFHHLVVEQMGRAGLGYKTA